MAYFYYFLLAKYHLLHPKKNSPVAFGLFDKTYILIFFIEIYKSLNDLWCLFEFQ